MAHRVFKDSFGRSWDAWSVIPERAERRKTDSAEGAPDEDRRHLKEFRVHLSDKWTNGWLAFETKGEKRRLAPIPENWDQLDEADLDRLRESAEPIDGASRRLVE